MSLPVVLALIALWMVAVTVVIAVVGAASRHERRARSGATRRHASLEPRAQRAATPRTSRSHTSVA